MIPSHPFRTPILTGPQVGWFRPAAAVVLGLLVPAIIAIICLLLVSPTIAGPPKDGSGFAVSGHISLVLAALSASFLVSWMLAPFALLLLRAAAMLGYAGWGSALIVALALGLPTLHIALMGDVTSEDSSILPHITVAIALLGLSVWAVFWGLLARQQKSLNFARKK